MNLCPTERAAASGAFFVLLAYLSQMRAKEIATQFERLPLASQRLVAELIEHLSRPPLAVSTWEEVAAGPLTEAIMLPPLNTDDIPKIWPENSFMEPAQHGAWAQQKDITDSTEFVRQLRREQWG